MKALSIKQPWAWLICAGYKDIENRNWKIGRGSQHGPYSSYHQANFTIELPCRIYVHAGKKVDEDIPIDMIDLIDSRLPPEAKESFWRMCDEQGFQPFLGGIIGEVDIAGCVTESDSPWFTGKYGFTLANPVLYEKPISYRGQLGFFEVDLVLGGLSQRERNEQDKNRVVRLHD
jgi:hypothetical protein